MPSDSLKRRNKVFPFVLATTTLAEAAAAAPDDDRVEFVALVGALGCQKRKVQDLLEKGELWSLLQQEAEKLHKSLDLASFFDFCKREMQSPAPISCSLLSPELKPFDVSLLVPVEDVKVPPVSASAPPFTSEPGWLEETERLVLEHYKAES